MGRRGRDGPRNAHGNYQGNDGPRGPPGRPAFRPGPPDMQNPPRGFPGPPFGQPPPRFMRPMGPRPIPQMSGQQPGQPPSGLPPPPIRAMMPSLPPLGGPPPFQPPSRPQGDGPAGRPPWPHLGGMRPPTRPQPNGLLPTGFNGFPGQPPAPPGGQMAPSQPNLPMAPVPPAQDPAAVQAATAAAIKAAVAAQGPAKALAKGHPGEDDSDDAEPLIGPAERPKGASSNRQDEDKEEEEERVKKAWAVHKTEDGKEYYFNALTNQSSWDKPEGFSGEFVEAKPTSQVRVPGTSWYEVQCEDGRKYFHNEHTQETTWTAPEEVLDVRKKVKEAKSPALAAVSKAKRAEPKDASKAVKRGREIEAIIPGVTQPPLPMELPPPLAPVVKRAKPMHLLQEAFFDLLHEKGVTPFSLWERELPKLIGDPRYQDIPNMKDRRAAFEEFCKKHAGSRKRQKLEATVNGSSKVDDPSKTPEQAEADFEAMLKDADLKSDMAFSQVEEKLSKDERWKACSEDRRPDLVKKRLASLDKQDAKKKEGADAASFSRDYRALLTASKISSTSRWSKSKDSLAKDPRYQAVPRDLRETLFRDFVADQKKLEDLKERERQEQSKKERSVKERLEKDIKDAESRRKAAAHAEALSNYETLLNEMVKDVKASWSDWNPRLQRDPQGRGSNVNMSNKEAEQRFHSHIQTLKKKAQNAFIELLEQTLRPLLPKTKEEKLPSELRSFREADRLWADDTRSVRVSSRDREHLFYKVADELVMERDDPKKLHHHARLLSRGKKPEQEPKVSRYAEDGPDKAYERAYIDHDRKRLRRG